MGKQRGRTAKSCVRKQSTKKLRGQCTGEQLLEYNWFVMSCYISNQRVLLFCLDSANFYCTSHIGRHEDGTCFHVDLNLLQCF